MKKFISKNNVFLVADPKSVIQMKMKDVNLLEKVYMVLDVNNVDNLAKLSKKLLNLSKKCYKFNESIKISLLVKSNGNEVLQNDVIQCATAALCRSKKERIEFIYNAVCNYLDEEFVKNNYCEFKNDICKAKRNCKGNVTMGCCHKFKNFLKNKTVVCPYLKDTKCSAECITCKLFTCNVIKKRFKLKDIPLIKVYFDPIQKFIIKSSYFTRKEVIINRLLMW